MNQRHQTDVDKWEISDLIDAVSEKPKKKKKIRLPKFQRSLVWSPEQRHTFIKSIKSGFPFGSLLLYMIKQDEGGMIQYSLIDGLQRTTTLKDYMEQPTKYFDVNSIDKELINKGLRVISLSDDEKLIKIIGTWVEELKGFEAKHHFSPGDLANEIDNKLNLDLDKNTLSELTNVLRPFIDDIESESDITTIKVPVLIYTGDESNLPTIFERLNSKGTKLDKYQIYASTWSTPNNEIKITNRQIIEAIKAKYDALIAEGYEILNYDPDSQDFYTGSFNIFEYVYGLGKFLSKRYPHLFGGYLNEDDGEDTSSDVDSIGFNLCTACLGLELAHMDKLPEKLMSKFKLGQDKLENCLIDSIGFVYNELKPFITLRGNEAKIDPKKRRIFPYHSEYCQWQW